VLVNSKRFVAGAAGAVLILGAAQMPTLAQDAQGVFTADQASRGMETFNSQCAMCHGRNLQGGEAPPLAGVDIMGNWATADAMYGYFSVAMPPQAPGQLGEQAYLDIMAHILSFNGAQPGEEELTTAALPSINLVEVTQAGEAAAQANAPAAAGPAAPASAQAAAAPAAEAAPAASVPQAFTFGRELPAVEAAQAPAPVVDAATGAAVPQAFTFGKELPTVTPAAPANP
jgi:mono/diheme cytochrome c family protein